MTQQEDVKRKSRRDLLLILLFLPFGMLCIFLIGGMAIELSPAFTLKADMNSRLDIAKEFALHSQPLLIEPISEGIFLPPSWELPGELPPPVATQPPVIPPSPVPTTETPGTEPPPPPTTPPPSPPPTSPPPTTPPPTPPWPKRPDLSISKTDSRTTYTPGNPVTYIIKVLNAGDGDAVSVTVADKFDTSILSNISWTCTASGGATCTTTGSGNIKDTVNLPADSSVTYTVKADTAPGATGTLSNTASITYNGSTKFAKDTDIANPQANLTINKTDGSTAYVPGSPVRYTIAVTNTGPSDATGATVTDTFNSAILSNTTWTCAASAGASCTASGAGNINDTVNLPAGSSVIYTVDADTAPSATENLVNTAYVIYGGVTRSATDTDAVNPQINLSITKTDGSDTYVPGNPVQYTITAANTGISTATGARVIDTFNTAILSNITWTCTASSGANCTANGTGNISDTVNLPANSSITYIVNANTAPGAKGNLVNTASVSYNGLSETATDIDTADPQVNLAITKTDGSATYTPGNPVKYTITVTNTGPSNATGAAVTDTFDTAILSNIGWTCTTSAGASCTASGLGNINDTVNMPVGSSVTYTVNADTVSGATAQLSNTALVTYNGVTRAATDIDAADPQVNLTIIKTDGSLTYTPGNPVQYTVTVSNTGPSDAVGATISDAFDTTILSNIAWTCVSSGGASCANVSGNGDINNESVDLPASSSVTFTIDADTASSATTQLVNTASVTYNGVTRSATDRDAADPQVNLTITKTDGSLTYTPGNPVRYTVTVSNTGPSDAVGATVTDTFDTSILSNITWTCAASGGASCVNASGTGDINSESVDLPGGSSVTFTSNANTPSNTLATLSNTASVTYDGVTQSATDTSTANPQSNLSIDKTDNKSAYFPGKAVRYIITVSNAGPSDAVGATVTDTFDTSILSNITWSCLASGGASCDSPANGTGNINDTVNLPAGSSVIYTVDADTAPGAMGPLVNTASVTYAGVTVSDTDTDVRAEYISLGEPDGTPHHLTPGAYEDYTLTTPITIDGNSDYEIVFYEWDRPNPPAEVELDKIILLIGDGTNWYRVYYWGDTTIDTNAFPVLPIPPLPVPYQEIDNYPVSTSLLYGSPYQSGILINADGGLGSPPNGTYPYIRIECPPLGPGDDAGCDVDTIEVWP